MFIFCVQILSVCSLTGLTASSLRQLSQIAGVWQLFVHATRYLSLFPNRCLAAPGVFFRPFLRVLIEALKGCVSSDTCEILAVASVPF